MTADSRDAQGTTDEPISRREFSLRLGAAAVGGAVLSSERGDSLSKYSAPHMTPPSTAADLCFLPATELVALLRTKKVSAREVMQAHLAQIERVNPKVNAIVTLVADRAMADAAKADEAIAHGRPRGPLHGLPVAHKDLSTPPAFAPRADRRTIATTFRRTMRRSSSASRRRRDHGRQDKHAGVRRGIADIQPVFGATKNPYDITKTVRWQQRRRRGVARVRHGADRRRQRHRRLAAKPRVVLQRRRAPPVARPRRRTTRTRGHRSSVSGPMARTVADVALLLSAIAGPDPHDPLSINEDPAHVRATARAQLQGRARRVVERTRRNSVRAGDPARRRRESQSIRVARLHRRGGGAGFQRRRHRVPDAAASRRITAATRALARAAPGHG